MPGPWPCAGGRGQLIICMVQLGAILQFSLTGIQASFCRHKEPNSPEVQFVHQYKLLLSHPLHPIPLPCCHIPASFHASNLSFPNRLGIAEGRDSLFGLAPLFSPQSIPAIPACSEKSHLPHFQVPNEAGSGCAGSGFPDQPAVEKQHLKAKYFLQQTQPETVKQTKPGCLCCPKITPMTFSIGSLLWERAQVPAERCFCSQD